MYTFKPLKKKATGKWDYATIDHFGNAEPVGCCMEYWRDGHRDGHHATAQDAANGFKEHLFERLRLDGTTFVAAECAVCKAPTFRAAIFGKDDGPEESVVIAHLCKDHLSKDVVLSLITDHPIETVQETFDKHERSSLLADSSEHENLSDDIE